MSCDVDYVDQIMFLAERTMNVLQAIWHNINATVSNEENLVTCPRQDWRC